MNRVNFKNAYRAFFSALLILFVAGMATNSVFAAPLSENDDDAARISPKDDYMGFWQHYDVMFVSPGPVVVLLLLAFEFYFFAVSNFIKKNQPVGNFFSIRSPPAKKGFGILLLN